MSSSTTRSPEAHGLYDPRFEHDACGIGFVAQVHGKASHRIVLDADEVLRNMEHRGASGAEVNTGDGAGMLNPMKLAGIHMAIKTGMLAAETIVVSETGARLSPKAAPLKMAPISAAGSPSRTIPAGYMTAVKPTTVPSPVPTDTANKADETKTPTTSSLETFIPRPIPLRGGRISFFEAATKPVSVLTFSEARPACG